MYLKQSNQPDTRPSINVNYFLFQLFRKFKFCVLEDYKQFGRTNDNKKNKREAQTANISVKSTKLFNSG